VAITASSALNAIAHAVEAFYAPGANPVTALVAEEAIRALADGMPAAVADPADRQARHRTLWGAYLAASALAVAGTGLHHKICHVLGGAYNLPHAETHAIVLPYVLAFNAAAAPDAAARIAAAFGSPQATDGLQRLRDRLNAPRALRDYGLTEANIPEAVRLSLAAIPASNPRPVTADNLTTLLTAAWSGQKPSELEIDHIRKEEP
jgi:maleylacetate reductase